MPTNCDALYSFGSELLVMKSLRLPKRLTMHGDDEKDHMFLVSPRWRPLLLPRIALAAAMMPSPRVSGRGGYSFHVWP